MPIIDYAGQLLDTALGTLGYGVYLFTLRFEPLYPMS